MTLLAIPFPDIKPEIFSIGPFAVRWYALAYIAGLVIGWQIMRRVCTQPPKVLKPEKIDDFLLWAALGVILGGRLGYVLFYKPGEFLAHPMQILIIWEGGMSFHGGLLGVILAMTLFSWKRGIRTWTLFDVVAAGVPVGLGLVRVANFINSELWGRPTDVPWAVEFPNGGPFSRHPSQLYEALLEGLVLFVVLRFLTHSRFKLKTPRFVGGAFICGYGLSRIFVEFFREPDQQLGYLLGTNWLTMGMILSTPMVLAGIWAMATARPATQPQAA